nr:unnamed protein product [Callosobruchus chinensis]
MLANILLQSLWKLSLSWDDPIPSGLNSAFIKFLTNFKNIRSYSVPRHTLIQNHNHIQIHAFSDASILDSQGNCQVSLLCSKSRVAPVKTVSLPRLELCGALVAAKLVKSAIDSVKIHADQVFYWTHSEIVLAWLSQKASTWKTFIANRVSKIQQLTDISCWRHVSSSCNPADLVSRGCSVHELIETDLWWSVLHKASTELWPMSQNKLSDIPEQRAVKASNTVSLCERFDLISRVPNYKHW